jgi:hypothetical protein
LSVSEEGKAATFVDPTDGSVDLLNDRPPLILEARVLRPDGSPFDLVVINNHLRSLNDVDDPIAGPRVRAKRRAQAEYLASLIQDQQTANPGARIIAIGDFNAFEVNDGYVDVLGTIGGTPAPADEVVLASPDLVAPNLTNLVASLPPAERYSYSFDGSAQVLDHALVSSGLLPWVSGFAYSRLDADYPESMRNDANRPERLSDHEATLTYIALGAPKLTGTVVARTQRVRGRMQLTLRLTNTGGGNAANVTIDSVTFRTLSGSGMVTRAVPAPIVVGNIPAGQFRDVTIALTVPAGVRRFSMTESVTRADAAGTPGTLSLTQSVTP